MDDAEFLRIYPRVLLVPERGLFPVVDLPANYRKLVPGFYAVRGREKVDEYAARVQQMIGFDVRLNWDESEGLRNISVGVQGGFDLNDSPLPHFQEHNLGGGNGFYAMAVALEYMRELLSQ